MRTALFGVALLAIAAAAGCGSKAESLIDKGIRLTNKLADAIESGAPEAEIQKIGKEITETGKALKELKVSKAEEKRLEEKYKEPMEKAAQRLQKAMFARMKTEMGKGMGEMLKNIPQPTMP